MGYLVVSVLVAVGLYWAYTKGYFSKVETKVEEVKKDVEEKVTEAVNEVKDKMNMK